MAYDLTTSDGLSAALEEAGGVIAELSRRSGVPESTLRGWLKKFGIRPGASAALIELQHSTGDVEKPSRRPLGKRPETKALVAAVTAARRRKLEAALDGETTDLSVTEFNLLIEVDSVLEEHDHVRLLRAASLAIQAYPKRYTGASQRDYIRNVAAQARVDSKDLDAYILVLQGEIKYREKTGLSRPDNLPTLGDTDRASPPPGGAGSSPGGQP